MKALVDLSAPDLFITQDLGLGMMLWMTHFFPEEEWQYRSAAVACDSSTDVAKGQLFLSRAGPADVKIAFTNYGVSVGLQAVRAMPQSVLRLNQSSIASGRAMNMIGRPSPRHVLHFAPAGIFLRDYRGSVHHPQ